VNNIRDEKKTCVGNWLHTVPKNDHDTKLKAGSEENITRSHLLLNVFFLTCPKTFRGATAYSIINITVLSRLGEAIRNTLFCWIIFCYHSWFETICMVKGTINKVDLTNKKTELWRLSIIPLERDGNLSRVSPPAAPCTCPGVCLCLLSVVCSLWAELCPPEQPEELHPPSAEEPRTAPRRPYTPPGRRRCWTRTSRSLPPLPSYVFVLQLLSQTHGVCITSENPPCVWKTPSLLMVFLKADDGKELVCVTACVGWACVLVSGDSSSHILFLFF